LGIGDWAQSPIPNPQSPIPNPQININNIKKIINYFFLNILIDYLKYILIKILLQKYSIFALIDVKRINYII